MPHHEQDQIAVVRPRIVNTLAAPSLNSNSTDATFKLQPAPPKRNFKRSVATRHASPSRGRNSDEGGRFVERFSLDQLPSTAMLDHVASLSRSSSRASSISSPLAAASPDSPLDPTLPQTPKYSRTLPDEEQELDVTTPRASRSDFVPKDDDAKVSKTLALKSHSAATLSTRPDTPPSLCSLASSSASSSPSSSSTAASPPPRSSTPTATSEMTFLLTNKSPSATSPLFPRRTIFRSLSSSCLNSPTSPLRTPTLRTPTTLRKRLGWRGRAYECRQDETSIPISPGSPLTPNRARSLHTPTQPTSMQGAALSLLDCSNSLSVPVPEQDGEPLSATLKALGAKRHSEKYILTSPTFSATQQDANDLSFQSLLSTNAHESFQVLTATRSKIFHLPTWAKFQSNHQTRSRLLEENRKAVDEFRSMADHSAKSQKQDRKDLSGVSSDHDDMTTEVLLLPHISHAGDHEPDSPNGHLFSGFDGEEDDDVNDRLSTLGHGGTESKSDVGHRRRLSRASFSTPDRVQVIRRPAIATLRAAKPRKDSPLSSNKVSTLVGALRGPSKPDFGQRDGDDRPYLGGDVSDGSISRPVRRSEDRRDGWGGILTRVSWFRGHSKGPLVSPDRRVRFVDQQPTGHSQKSAGLKSLYLAPSASTTSRLGTIDENGRATNESDEWEDVPDRPSPKSAGSQSDAEKSFLDLHDAPRFRNFRASEAFKRPSWWEWRPAKSAAPRASSPSASFASIPLLNPNRHSFESDEKRGCAVEEPSASTVLATSKSIENRPMKRSARSRLGAIRRKATARNVLLLVLIGGLAASVITNIALVSNKEPQKVVGKLSSNPVDASTVSTSNATNTAEGTIPAASATASAPVSADNPAPSSTSSTTTSEAEHEPSPTSDLSTVQKAADLSQATPTQSAIYTFF
ncbi:hypothetical protein BCV70DRAFT_237572 [Testicularia cyperi]|uniref:Uncharacterized protein n=1 Tax=Testicularia cyperi TaxID=1882483 RepID=A0A317XQU7_9BASI|nr:hypothetical protein BCV70DRAFT_237572 [Testicularia cyperi]